jgi:signal transduction histidine kinase
VIDRRWSLTRRLTLYFLLGTTALVVAVAAVSDNYLRNAANTELDAIAEARLKDLRVRSQALSSFEGDPSQPPPNDELIRLADEIAREGPYPVAWRFWSLAHGWVSGEAGARELLSAGIPAREPSKLTQRLPRGGRWRTETFQNGMDVGILLDGSSRIEALRNYELVTALMLVVGALGGTLMGWLLLSRASQVLKSVAASARRVQAPAEGVDVDVRGAPDEIRDVVDAMHQLLRNIQVATERHRVLYASMAHELRAPIQNLVGATEVALLSRREADSYRKVLESNLEELRELGDAIDNLMTICAPRTLAVHSPVSEDFDLAAEARLRLERERARAERLGVAVDIEVRGNTQMRGDRELMLRALRNLVANAIEWCKRDGVVEVSITGLDDDIVILVDDQGPGVPLELREKIFDPFYRGSTAHGRRVGYGLGLAMVKDAADRHAAAVAVETSPSGGARFRMTVPRKGLSAAAQRAALAR